MSSSPKSPFLLLVVAVSCMSSSFLFIRLSNMDAAPLAASRLILSSAFTLPLFLRARRQSRQTFQWKHLRGCVAPGMAFGLHLILWNVSCRMTSAANATLIVNMSPIALPFALWLFARERINRSEVIATLFALLGLGVLALFDHRGSDGHFAGDAMCLLAMLVLACYLALARRIAPQFPVPWLFIVPVYGMAAITCSAWALFTGQGLWPETLRGWSCILGLVVFPTVLGHGLCLAALRHCRGQIVGLFGASQFLPASLLAWIFLREAPALPFFPAAALVLTGMVIALRAHKD